MQKKKKTFRAYGFFWDSRNTHILWSESGLNILLVLLGLEVLCFISWWGFWRIPLFTKWSSELQHESALKTYMKSINFLFVIHALYVFVLSLKTCEVQRHKRIPLPVTAFFWVFWRCIFFKLHMCWDGCCAVPSATQCVLVPVLAGKGEISHCAPNLAMSSTCRNVTSK